MPSLQQIVTGTIINTLFHDFYTYACKALRKVFNDMERVYCYFAMSQVLFTHISIRFPHINRNVLYLVSLRLWDHFKVFRRVTFERFGSISFNVLLLLSTNTHKYEPPYFAMEEDISSIPRFSGSVNLGARMKLSVYILSNFLRGFDD